MSLFEKIECEPIEPEEPVDAPPPSWHRTGETLTVAYKPMMQASILVLPLIMLPIVQLMLEEGSMMLEAMAVTAVVMGAWYAGDCLLTRDFTFSPERIVKRGLFGRTVLPTAALKMNVDQQNIRLYHGSDKNFREAVTIRRFLIAGEESADILDYARDVYRVNAGNRKGTAAEGKAPPSKMAVMEFEKSTASYQTMAAFFAVFAIIAILTSGLSDNFNGFATSLPPYPARLVCICLTLAGFFLLRMLAKPSAGEVAGREPVTVRLKRLDRQAFIPAVAAIVVAGLGLGLFFLFGNLLDFYLFLMVGILYFRDFHPRLSTWEQAVSGAAATAQEESAPLPLTRRSLQVSLVLMGALAVLSYGEDRRYLYSSRQDCLNDWGDDKDCKEAPTGSGSSGTRHWYGPRYGSGGRPTRSVGVATVSRGGFGSLGSFHASFGG